MEEMDAITARIYESISEDNETHVYFLRRADGWRK